MPKMMIDLSEEADKNVRRIQLELELKHDLDLNKDETVVETLENVDVDKMVERIGGNDD